MTPPSRSKRAASVLIIEDDASLGELMGAIVDHLGMRPVLARGLAEAVILTKDRLPDVIVTDLFEGRYSTLDLSPLQRLFGTWPNVPIVLCTARLDADLIDPAKQGLYAVILKPFDLEHFLDVIRRAVTRRRRRTESIA